MNRTTLALSALLSMAGSFAQAAIFTPNDTALASFAVVGHNNLTSVTDWGTTANPSYDDGSAMSASFGYGIDFSFRGADDSGNSYVNIGVENADLSGSTSFELELVNDNQSTYQYALFVTDGINTVVGTPFLSLTGTHNAQHSVQDGVNASLLSVDLTSFSDLTGVTYGFRVLIDTNAGGSNNPSVSDEAYVAFDNDGGDSIVEVPEPSSFAVIGGLGLIGLVFGRRRRLSTKAS